MAFKHTVPAAGTMAIAARAIALGGAAFAAIWLLSLHLYATALVVCGLGAVIAGDLMRTVAKSERRLEHFLETLTAGTFPRRTGGIAGYPRLTIAIERTAAALNVAREKHDQRVEFLQVLLDAVSAVLITQGPDGRILLANAAARKLAGAQASHLDTIAAIGEAAAQGLLELQPGARQIFRLANGWQVLGSSAHFTTPDGGTHRLIALQRIAGELDAVELKAYQDMVHVLAHEMMNSLTPISSLSESLGALMGDGQKSEEVVSAVDAIKRRSLGLMDFVERYRKVLELPQPRKESVRMVDFLAGIERLMRSSLDERQIALDWCVSPTELTVRADPILLEQAVINLVSNAKDAVESIPDGNIELSCSAENGRVLIAIKDNGTGLPVEQLEKIFVPFFTTKQNGSGVGLTLSRHIAQAHGGRLEVHHNVDRGMTFRLILPS